MTQDQQDRIVRLLALLVEAEHARGKREEEIDRLAPQQAEILRQMSGSHESQLEELAEKRRAHQALIADMALASTDVADRIEALYAKQAELLESVLAKLAFQDSGRRH